MGVAVVVACLVQSPAWACGLGLDNPCKNALSIGELLRPGYDRSLLMADLPSSDRRARWAGSPVQASAFARAIARAAKRSASELALEAATKIIVMCQKERNPALTTPFFRSDSQQAHCFRY